VYADESLEFVLRKPLGRLAAAVLASIAIPLALAPVALASTPALTTLSSDKSFKDNVASGIDLPDGTGLLRIASTTGLPTNIMSKDFDVIETAYQAEEDGRFWDVTVKLKEGHSFKKGDVTASWHCPGHGAKDSHETKESESTTTKPTSTKTTKTTTTTKPTSTTTKPTSTTGETTSTTVHTTTSAPTKTSAPAPGGGDVVDAPVKPAAPAGRSTPQVRFTPVGGVETGFGFLAG
jgi:hypothetical protein